MKPFLILLIGLAAVGAVPAPAQLDSADWRMREAAFKQIPKLSPLPIEMRDQLIALLRRENQVIESTLNESGGQKGVSDVYGEGYGEYYSSVLRTVGEFAKAGDTRALAIVADGAYYTGSRWANFIVDGWPVTLPVFLAKKDRTAGGGIHYAQALEMLGRIFGAHRPDLPREQADEIVSRISKGISDPSGGVRQAAIEAAVHARLTEVLPLLRKCALEDPATEGPENAKFYPIRRAAELAIRQIEQHD